MEGLEDDADVRAAKPRERVLAQTAELDAVDLDLAFVRALESGHDHQQRRFARTGGADDADRLAVGDCQTDVAQDMHTRGAPAEAEIDAAHRDCGKGHRVGNPEARGRPHMGIGGASSRRLPWRPSWLWPPAGTASARTLRLVVLGDSLTAGYGLPPGKAFPDQLQAALNARGWDVEVVNAGVSGDTAEDGLARYDWAVPADADALIVELGANDMLRGLPPEGTKAALAAILDRAKAAHLPTLIAGMRAAPNLGADYAQAFDAIYPAAAGAAGAILYPFFLDGVAGDPRLNQPDGLHPTAAGAAVIVEPNPAVGRGSPPARKVLIRNMRSPVRRWSGRSCAPAPARRS